MRWIHEHDYPSPCLLHQITVTQLDICCSSVLPDNQDGTRGTVARHAFLYSSSASL